MCIDNKSSVFIASLEISERCAVEEWLGVRKGRRWRFDGVEMSKIRILLSYPVIHLCFFVK